MQRELLQQQQQQHTVACIVDVDLHILFSSGKESMLLQGYAVFT